MAKLYYLGHCSFRIVTDENKVIYLDPYAGSNYSLKADYVFISHEHYDHNDLSKVNVDEKTNTIRAKDCIILENNTISYKTFADNYLKVISTPAGNLNHPLVSSVGFILEFDNKKIYFAGDTSYLPFMKDNLPSFNLDYAILPCDGIYNMDILEAMQVAKVIKARKVIPMSLLPGNLYSETVARRFNIDNALLLRPDEEIIL